MKWDDLVFDSVWMGGEMGWGHSVSEYSPEMRDDLIPPNRADRAVPLCPRCRRLLSVALAKVGHGSRGQDELTAHESSELERPPMASPIWRGNQSWASAAMRSLANSQDAVR